ncbi:rod shape-determining protein MreC [Alkalicoccobacillus porphyridii]|uniref:Cell shape-determining protein MreC n=1 Tax=Alkalicoccobacillus porphyridii TaxID=2597270 RepID=A0A553ZXP7_9BACI|nr:rod shape-determining protein MreC [Alkalicoccobacillus porphyridii]TSB46231.1 rod shape-determining protein MreC [Alkalicoccobacillus porphyridii]
MPSFFSNKKLIILLVSIIILVALIGYSTGGRESASGPEKIVRDSVGWVQNLFSTPAHFVGGFIDNVRDIRDIYEENQLLKSRLEEYAQITVERNQLANENQTLQDMLDLQDTLNDYVKRPATVIHRNPDLWTQYVGINLGEDHNISADMAVVDSNGGLVGKVKRTSQFTSYVQLLSDNDPSNQVSAQIMDGEDIPGYGFIEGYDEDRDLLILRKIDIEADIEPEQVVTTSGLGDVYPAGLILGEIEEVELDEYGLSQTAYIRPTADFSSFSYLYVVERGTDVMDPALLEEGE